jgi:hypothetical protein
LGGGYFYLSYRDITPKAPLGLSGNQTGGNVFTSIKDALSKSLSLKCVYKNEEGVETTTYIKGGAVRVMMTSAAAGDEQPDNIIMKNKMMYMWNNTTKTGFSLKLEEPKDLTPFPTVKQDRNAVKKEDQQESVLAEIEKYKDACKAEVVSDSMFSVPTDVKFQDMNALQEQMMKKVPQVPQVGNQEDAQKYIQEMMQQQGAEQ